MNENGDEVCLTDIELELMQIFVKHKILNRESILCILAQLYGKNL